MKRIIKIWRVIAKTSGGYGVANDVDPNKRTLIYVMLTIAAVAIGSALYGGFYSLFKMIQGYNLDAYIFNMYVVSVTSIILLYGIFDFMSIFYFADDLKWYQHLPIKPYITIAVKFIIVIFHQCIVALLFVPLILSYGVLNSFGLAYYLLSILFIVLIPFIPCTVSGIIAMLLMRFSTFAKRKDLFKLIVGIISVSMGLIFNVVLRNILETNAMSKLVDNYGVISESPGFIFVTKLLIPYKFFIDGITNSDYLLAFGGIFIMFISTIISVLVMIYIGNKVYTKGATGLDETPVKNKKDKTKYEVNKKISHKRKTVLSAFIKKEFTCIIRDPSLIVQYIVTPLILPVYFIFMSSSGSLESIVSSSDGIPIFSYHWMIIFMGLIVFLSPLYVTGISREGKSYYINKFIPIKKALYFKGKMIVNFIVGCEIVVLVFGILVYYKLPIHIVATTLAILISFVSLAVVSGFHIEVDNPKLTWNNLNELFKRNFNTWGMMFTYVVIVVITSLTAMYINIVNNVNILLYGIIVVTLNMTLTMIVLHKLKKKTIKA